MNVALNSGILRRQAEGVKPDRKDDVEAAHAQVARPGIGGRHGKPMADVQVAGGVGQHGQEVELRPAGVDHGAVQTIRLPTLLPLALDRRRVVALRPLRSLGPRRSG